MTRIIRKILQARLHDDNYLLNNRTKAHTAHHGTPGKHIGPYTTPPRQIISVSLRLHWLGVRSGMYGGTWDTNKRQQY